MSGSQRPSGRAADELRQVRLTREFTKHPAGSVLVEFGDTRVLCTASVEDQVPRFLRGSRRGWITAEYGMLPGATHTRADREAVRGKQGGRTVEIQRLIGRSLRAAVDLRRLGERTIKLDCDVIQADGGTRTASITGACVALADAVGKVAPKAFRGFVASVSVGVFKGECVLDLDYSEDSNADTDMNVVMMQGHGFIEVQGTAEGSPFARDSLNRLLDLAESGIETLFKRQREALGSHHPVGSLQPVESLQAAETDGSS